jgi:hypothetical protein
MNIHLVIISLENQLSDLKVELKKRLDHYEIVARLSSYEDSLDVGVLELQNRIEALNYAIAYIKQNEKINYNPIICSDFSES